jgi:hypothetical protein
MMIIWWLDSNRTWVSYSNIPSEWQNTNPLPTTKLRNEYKINTHPRQEDDDDLSRGHLPLCNMTNYPFRPDHLQSALSLEEEGRSKCRILDASLWSLVLEVIGIDLTWEREAKGWARMYCISADMPSRMQFPQYIRGSCKDGNLI